MFKFLFRFSIALAVISFVWIFLTHMRFTISMIIVPIALILPSIIYGSAIISSKLFIKNTYLVGDTSKKQISLTFDDGPHPEITLKIAQLLEQFKVKATFFCIGKNIEKHPEVIKELALHQHEIGNHSYSHGPLIDFYPKRKWRDECAKTDQLIEQYTNLKVKLFRPPYGVTNPAIAAICKERDYNVIGWSLRTLDTSIKNTSKLEKRLFKKLKNGDVILFHDTQKHILPVLKKFLEYCLQEDIQVVPLSVLHSIKVYK